MLEKFLVLLERFVVAHELIAANSVKQPTNKSVGELTVDVAVTGVETVKKELAKALEEVDYQSLRDQIQAIDDAINEGPSDAACDDSDELLEEFTGKKMKIAAIKDEDLAEYLERLTAIKNKYFEEE